MIGDIPENAGPQCRLGRHTNQERGGTMVFTCGRCGGSFWQEHDFRAVTAMADAMIDCGETDEALKFVRRSVQRSYE